jgi:hypothetical protein
MFLYINFDTPKYDRKMNYLTLTPMNSVSNISTILSSVGMGVDTPLALWHIGILVAVPELRSQDFIFLIRK